MKTLTFALALTLSFATSALGQGKQPQYQFESLNCNAFQGKPFVCLQNDTDRLVTDIDCEVKTGIIFKSTGTKSITLPKGGVPPHSLTIVDTAEACTTTLIFYLSGVPARRLEGVNTNAATILVVPLK